MLLLATNEREKTLQSQERRNLKSVRSIGYLNWCYNFALVLHEDALIFSQSEAHVFFICIIVRNFPLVQYFHTKLDIKTLVLFCRQD